VRNDGGEVQLAIVVFREITEQRRLEGQREEYLALITHDLRNPLSAILMALFVLKESSKQKSLVASDILQLAERAERNVVRITSMLNELAEATTLELRGVELHRKPCDLRKVLASALDAMDDARAGRVTSEVGGAASYVVLGDVAQLERVVGNLVSNALKYSPPDRRVSVRLTRADHVVQLDVTDQGIGIAPESLKTVFERYGRAPAGRAAASGLGLGLYIARLIVEAHGGRIEVSSELGVGSTFSLILPSES
jgi:signal transduction histidine kinase